MREHLARRTGVAAASAALDRATEALTAEDDSVATYSAALERFLALGGDDFDARAAQVCAEVGLGDDRGPQATASLSGGEAARVALAGILLARFDVLALDEPTNDLDFAGIDLLEDFVDGFAGAVVVVSHDRAFLDRTVDRIVAIDEHLHGTREFAGGWTDFVAARDLARRQQSEAHERFVTERDRLRQRQRTQLEWSDRGVRRAHTSGENDKNLRHRKVARSEKQAGKVKATERRLAHLEAVDKPWEGWRLQLELAPDRRSGAVVARLDGAVVELPPGDPSGFRLGPIDLEIAWQDRVAVLGPNGSGKSTLLRALLGEVPLAAGRRWLGPGVVVGQLDQGRGRYAGTAGVLATFQASTAMVASESRSLLAKFGLGADHVDRAGRGSHRGSGPALCWPRSWPRASTAWSSTSPPTTSTSRPSSSSRRPWPSSRGRCCWSRTTVGSWRRSS